MGIKRDDECDDDEDESVLTVDEHIVALQQLMLAVLNRVANAAPNPFEELQTIRRLAAQHVERACIVHDRPVRPDRVADEADRFIRLSEKRLI